MKIKYSFNLNEQLISGIVSFLTVVVVTSVFDHEIKWALAIAVGAGTFFTTGLRQET